MQAWVVVMVVVLVAALALTIYGALHDRTLNRRRAEEMLGPPKRDIPNLPADARPPTYVTQAQARRRPTGTTSEGTTDRTTRLEGEIGDLRARLAEATSAPFEAYAERELAVGHASKEFATDERSGRAVLEEPLVLVCADPVETVRELLPALEQAVRAHRPVVVVAPRFAPDVLGTLEVNAIQGKVPGVAVVADEETRAELATISHATPVDGTDRRSGWMDAAAFGHLASWTSTRTSSRLVPLTRSGAAG